MLEHSEEFIKQYIAQLTEAGFHMHVHALSDRGVRVTAQAFADVKEQADSLQTTQSIAHAQLVHPDDQKLLGELGVYSVFTYVWILPGVEYDMSVIPFIDEVKGVADLYSHDHYYMQNVYPVGAMARQGVIPVFGSDTPVGGRDPIPFVSMYAALTREMDGVVLNESQRIGIDEVIASYTINAARMMDHDADLGSIEVGKVADLAVLNQNLVELAGSDNPLAITETQVDLTVFEGNVVFER